MDDQPVVLSASSVNTYVSCHLAWWFSYVAALPGERSEALDVGTAVHEAADLYLRGAVARDGVVHADPVLLPLERLFREEVMPTYGRAILVEEPFQIEVNGIPFGGTIDSLDEQRKSWGVEHILRDLKTTGSRPSPMRYRFNMVGYFVGVTEGLGHPVTAMQLDYIVRTKKPYYWPETQPIPDDYEVEGWAAQIEVVASGIARGDYQPTGLGTSACSWCGHRAQCGPYQRLNAASPLREEKE